LIEFAAWKNGVSRRVDFFFPVLRYADVGFDIIARTKEGIKDTKWYKTMKTKERTRVGREQEVDGEVKD
jgi:hypothetical protein